MTELVLSDDDLEALARRVVELMAEASVPPAVYLDTATVARTYSVQEQWVRAHAAELGAIRVGDGRRGELRFHVDRVEAAMERRRVTGRTPAPVRRRRPGPRRGTTSRNVQLLLLPEDVAS